MNLINSFHPWPINFSNVEETVEEEEKENRTIVKREPTITNPEKQLTKVTSAQKQEKRIKEIWDNNSNNK